MIFSLISGELVFFRTPPEVLDRVGVGWEEGVLSTREGGGLEDGRWSGGGWGRVWVMM